MYYFVSDIHLGAGGDLQSTHRAERRFTAWLDRISSDAKAVYLLGDIFDFWFEYHNVVPKGYVRTLAKLAELTERGVRVVFFTGNHDMWVGDYLSRECGVEVHTEPMLADIAGKRLFIAHGDNMKIDGKPLLKFMNAVFRSRVIRFLFSWLVHPDLAMWFGRWWSGKSRKSHGGEDISPAMLDPLTEYAAEVGSKEGADYCIFGHLHLADNRQAGSARAIFLNDWSRDPVCAVMDDAGDIRLENIDMP